MFESMYSHQFVLRGSLEIYEIIIMHIQEYD
jgi:hypothetical protein